MKGQLFTAKQGGMALAVFPTYTGHYRNGKFVLDDLVEIAEESRVLITVLNDDQPLKVKAAFQEEPYEVFSSAFREILGEHDGNLEEEFVCKQSNEI
jgi:hypothetical protein